MPELPEVETVKKVLNQKLKSKNYKILDLEIFWPKIIKNFSNDKFISLLINQTIKEVDRIGKHLLFILDDLVIISHLRMEGKYYFLNKNEELPNKKHILVLFHLSNNAKLAYYDTRRFGTMHLGDYNNFYNLKPLSKLAAEPWDIDNQWFIKQIQKSKKAIKTIILDQHVIAGIGNIYADEILFKSKINPWISGCDVSDEQITNILNNTKIVLEQAIKLGGTTIKSFTAGKEISGKFQNWLQVHTKKGEFCVNCHTIIEKSKVNGRGTYWCPQCQK